MDTEAIFAWSRDNIVFLNGAEISLNSVNLINH